MEINEKEIDKIIRKSYEDLKIDNSIFDEVYQNLEDKKSNKTIIKYLSGIAATIMIIVVVVIITVIPKEDNSSSTIIDGKNEEIDGELPIASGVINELGDSYQSMLNHLASPMGMSLIEEETEFVGVVKIEEIIGYTNYISKTNTYFPSPFIISEVSIEKVFKGELNGKLEIMSYGGVISVSDYLKSLQPGQSIDSKYQNLTDEEKENTFIKVINSFTLSTIEPEVDKYYLVFMNYNDDLEHYQVLDDLIYEYDIQNDKTKNTNTNEWEDYKFGVNE